MGEAGNNRRIVILNQASNYLTIGLANAFHHQGFEVSLVTGSVHVQGEPLIEAVKVDRINRWYERPVSRKTVSYLWALVRMWMLLRTRYRRHEVFFISVPPMGYLLNLLVPNTFSMLIWDVYPDIFRVSGMKSDHRIYRGWSKLNRRSFKKAYRLFTISEKMAEVLGAYIAPQKIIVQPIWSIFQSNERVNRSENPFLTKTDLADKFIVQYSGNIGHTHKLELLLEIAERMRDRSDVFFQIIGRGPRVSQIEQKIRDKGLGNCEFLPFQSDDVFPLSLSAADMGVVILDETVSKGSVPSKSYNLMAFGIPALYFAAEDSELNAYARKFGHARCFRENELDAAVLFIEQLSKDKEVWNSYSKAATAAAQLFKRSNADKLVRAYKEAGKVGTT